MSLGGLLTFLCPPGGVLWPERAVLTALQGLL